MEILFTILFVLIFGRLLLVAIKTAWTVLRFVFSLIFLPVTLIFAVIDGLIKLALPALLVIGVISLFTARRSF